MNKKISIGIAISIAAIACAITFILATTYSLDIYNKQVQDVKERAETYKKLDEIDTYIRNDFFGKIDDKEVLDSILKSYMGSIGDKYAKYLSVNEYQEQKLLEKGIQISSGVVPARDESGYIIVDDIIPNSSASQQEIEKGEYIVSVNGKDVLTEGYTKSVEAMTGISGTSIDVTVRNNGVDRDVNLILKELSISSITASYEDQIAYIKIHNFNSNSPSQIYSSAKSLISTGAKAIIFDVRDNNSGTVENAIDALNSILPSCKYATKTDKNGKIITIGVSDEKSINVPITVLVNSQTSGAAELFACALRDYSKAQLVGNRTEGKGVIETTKECLDGSAIVFTIATFQTPKTPQINGVGVKPDYEIDNKADNENTPTDTGEPLDEQLKKAREITIPLIKK